MQKRFISLLLLACALTVWHGAVAQNSAGDASGVTQAGPGGIGFRFMPSALTPTSGYSSDPSLGTALSLRYWVNPLFAVEAGGWAYSYEDASSKNSNTLITGGLLFKLASMQTHDFYLAGRGIHFVTASAGSGYYCPLDGVPPPPPAPGPKDVKPGPIMPPCWPWSSSKSETTTLAMEGTLGAEWKPLPKIGVDLEFGFIYSQTVTTNQMPVPPPFPVPSEPSQPPVKSSQTQETYASSTFSPTMHFEVIFYIF
ncbi:hypothetical protein HY229_08565 [Candidatus Acetothermia bacterium]|nr:hypothetical protein [Candidatus Acetothermia bacterium]MBI3644133.1 hypothetical protein [Candidatus Acetothermia bacterium]